MIERAMSGGIKLVFVPLNNTAMITAREFKVQLWFECVCVVYAVRLSMDVY